MAVYVDNMRAPFKGMVMCHMLADSEAELLAMAERIGMARHRHQYPGTYRSHFDISLDKRALAVDAGAIEITRRQVGLLLRAKRYGATREQA